MATELDEQQEKARASREALIGKSIANRYVLRALVGHGGMGAVYEAEHLGLGKRVAIKFVDPEFATDERVVARFAREARAMSAIESAHIVTVFDAGTEDGRPYLVMELLRGEDLGQRLRRMRRIPVEEAMHIVAQVLKGLAKAHAAGIVHRDLKPDNVFLVKSDTDPLFAKIVDFGISKIERPRDKTSPLALTGRGTVLGTPFYMCPEQAQAASDVDSRADIYSVGAILFECLTGRPPHTGETYEQIILSICMRDAPDLRAIDPSLSPDVASFVSRALARDRTERYGSAERMLAALHDIAPEEKKRVPLDGGAPETLASPGVLFPKGPVSSRPAPNPNGPASSREGPNSRPSANTQLVGSGAPLSTRGQHSDAAIAAATIVDPSGAGASASAAMRAAQPHPQIAGARPSQNNQRAAGGASAAAAAAPVASSALPSTSVGMGDSAMLSAIGIPSARRKRSLTTIIVTALIATLLGIGVMMGVIVMLNKKSEGSTALVGSSPSSTASGRTGTPATITSGVATTSPSTTPSSGTSASASTASTGSATAAASSTTSGKPGVGPRANGSSGSAGGAGGAGGGAAAKPIPTKLDIARDLP